MNHIRRSTFLLGFIIATLMAIIVWYYQKSTSAEDGALEVLDRYAQSQARVRQLEHELMSQGHDSDALSAGGQQADASRSAFRQVDDLRLINGIGPGYAQRLEEAGITSFAQLAATNAVELKNIVGTRPDVDQWIVEATSLAKS